MSNTLILEIEALGPYKAQVVFDVYSAPKLIVTESSLPRVYEFDYWTFHGCKGQAVVDAINKIKSGKTSSAPIGTQVNYYFPNAGKLNVDIDLNTGSSVWRPIDMNDPQLIKQRRPIKNNRISKKCTCGTQSVGGLCSSWCDLNDNS